MRLALPIAATAGVVFLLAAGNHASAEGAASEPLYVRQVMQEHINPAILAVWDVGNNAMNENGGIDPALMDDAKWSSLADAAARLASAAHEMEHAQEIRAAPTANSEVAEGEVTMAAVQQLLDADPAGFRQLAADLATHADQLATAAFSHNAATAGELVSGMDGVCENCHMRYWYPDQGA